MENWDTFVQLDVYPLLYLYLFINYLLVCLQVKFLVLDIQLRALL